MVKRIIFDIGHPAQVHQFKHLYRILEKRGWTCLFVAKDKDITINLLREYHFNYELLSGTKKRLLSKILQIPSNYFRFFKIVNQFKPAFILHRFSVHCAPIAKLLGVVNIGFSDTEYAFRLHCLTLPFVDFKFTGKSYYNKLGKNHFKYNGIIELFYLHPKYFINNVNPYELLGISPKQNYCLVRFVSWGAHHDVGLTTMNSEQKVELIHFLNKFYRVFISSEGELPDELVNYQIKINPIYIHSIIKSAALYIGEGASMASEAVCLGTPVIYTNPLPLTGDLKEQQSFGLLKHAWELSAIKELFNINSFNNQEDYPSYLSTKIDPTAFMVWFIENYPESFRIMKEDPGYQERFK